MKSRDRRKGRARAGARPTSIPESSVAPTVPGRIGAASASPEPSIETTRLDPLDRWFLPLAAAILLAAAALRLPELALNPFHHDEGVNGFFMENLVRAGTYAYDPANYHGPSLYYFALLSEILFGLTTEAMRLVPVAFGLLMVGLTLTLRRYLGSIAALTAGALLAVSPGAVYVSRYFIHETLLVAFSLALVVAITFYLDRRQARFLVAAGAAAALLFATKETGIITVVVLLIAAVLGHYYTAWRRPPKVASRKIVGHRATGARSAATSELLPRWIPGRHLAGAVAVFLVIYVLLYSSFFTNFPKGLIDSLATFTIWTQTGEATQVQPIYRYLQWLVPIGEPTLIPVDVPILLLGVIGGLVAAIRAPSRIWVVIGLWAAGITAAYSIIQYKTPWIVLNMLLPLALLAGLAVSELWRTRPLRLAAPVVLGVAVAVNGYQAIDLNFSRYDDPAYSYVYVHSTRSMLALVDEIELTADRAGTGRETGIVFVTPDYWPLPWYFRDYPRAGFFGSIVETQEAMIVANVNQEAELAPTIADRYERVGEYTLRPGVQLVLYVRSDIPKG